ncbi:MAG: prolyl oligopeptidase family serine peptidase [Bacteroidales bacterium]|nr:prolyl oligopeptidase family serine peptidase [Bacteroidales bacterium]
MKKVNIFLTALILCFTSALCMAEDFEKLPAHKFKCDGLERTYYLYLPEDLPEGAPLLFYLHGYGNRHPKSVEFCALADKEKFAVCIPHAAIDTYGKHGWNVGYEVQVGYKVDDVAFLKKLARYLQKKYSLSRENVFVAGLSNGGEMCYLLAYKAPDFVRAVAPLSGLTMKWMYDSLTPKKAVPLIEIHGTEDKTSHWNGCFDNHKWGPYIAVPLAVQNWAVAARCDHEITEELPLLSPDSHKVIAHKYVSDTNSGIQVQLYEVIGGGHGISTADLPYPQIVWDFFKHYMVTLK